MLLLHGHTGKVRALAYAPDGRRLASGGSDEAIKLFETAAKECPHGFLEGIAAAAELKGMGQKVGAN